jgi:hypothetical protein
MGSGGQKKTTMAKLARENRLRERRMNKQAKKDARKQAAADESHGSAAAVSLAEQPDDSPSTDRAGVDVEGTSTVTGPGA